MKLGEKLDPVTVEEIEQLRDLALPTLHRMRRAGQLDLNLHYMLARTVAGLEVDGFTSVFDWLVELVKRNREK